MRFALLALVTLGVLPASAQFAPQTTNPYGLSVVGIGVRSMPAVADLDADGDADVLVGEFNGGLYFFENTAGPNATPSFLSATQDPFGITRPASQFTTAPALADLDTDGDIDIVLAVETGILYVLLNGAGPNAEASFGPPQNAPYGLSTGPTFPSPAAADLDGDGDTDVVVGNSTGSFRVHINSAGPNATPAFEAVRVNPYGLSDIGSVSTVALVDLDLDGDMDLLAAERTQFFYFENTAGPGAATPSFLPPVTDPFGLDPSFNSPSPVVADLDGDGDLDVLAGESLGNLRYFEATRPVATEDDPGADAAVSLALAPMPASASSRATLRLDTPQRVRLDVIDALGRVVMVAFEGRVADEVSVDVDVRGLAPGVYRVVARGDTFVSSRALVVAR